MVSEGQLGSWSRVVAFNTATGLRYPHLSDGPVPIISASGSIDDTAIARQGRDGPDVACSPRSYWPRPGCSC